jgi:hypothetical protein
MIKHFTQFLFLTGCCTILYGQEVIGIVENASDQKPISTVHIINLNKVTRFQLTELALALEEVVVRPYQLTGYLDIDARNVPINRTRRYSIPGLPSGGYEAGNRTPLGEIRILQAISNPADFLYNIFGKKPKQLRKLKKARANNEIRDLLAVKYDRKTLVQLIQIDRVDLDEILRKCNFSDSFIKGANDLQILEAISNCYEEYKILNR